MSQAPSITGAVSFGLQRGLTDAISRGRGRLRVWRACSTLTIQLAAVDRVAAGYVLQYGDIFDAHDLALWSTPQDPLVGILRFVPSSRPPEAQATGGLALSLPQTIGSAPYAPCDTRCRRIYDSVTSLTDRKFVP